MSRRGNPRRAPRTTHLDGPHVVRVVVARHVLQRAVGSVRPGAGRRPHGAAVAGGGRVAVLQQLDASEYIADEDVIPVALGWRCGAAVGGLAGLDVRPCGGVQAGQRRTWGADRRGGVGVPGCE